MKPAESALSQLERLECHRKFKADLVESFCKDCFPPLLALYDLRLGDLQVSRELITSRPRGLWRWAERLAVRHTARRLTLGEGDTPLMQAPRIGPRIGLKRVYVKNEATNPTDTSKARGPAVVVSRAIELGRQSFVIPTVDNAGDALAFYAAHSRTETHAFIPKGTPPVIQEEIQVAGADLHSIDGLIKGAARISAEQSCRHHWLDVSTFKETIRSRGQKDNGTRTG